MRSEAIMDTIGKVRENLIERLGDSLKCLLLYGSWAKGSARKDSDIDLLAIFENVDAEVRKTLSDLSWMDDREITIVTCTMEEFQKEKIPLYTAIKQEGKVIWGGANLLLSPDPPGVKYAEFFKRSQEFESRKVEMAEWLLERGFLSSIPEYCFVVAKHAIQAALAMKGEGYSSKMAVLLPLARDKFGEKFAAAFKKLFDLYFRTDYGLESPSEEEAVAAIGNAREILKVYG